MSSVTTYRLLSRITAYLELGMVAEARGELSRIGREDWSRPEVLAARLMLHTCAHEWNFLVRFGRQLATLWPKLEAGWIGWALGLREMERITDARDVLLTAITRHHVDTAIVHFRLASYYSLLGQMGLAMEHSRRACTIDAALKAEALRDPDFTALREHPDFL